jgi:regulator of ribonuclease activity A
MQTAGISTPGLCDAHEGSIRIVGPGLRSFGGHRAFGGEIVTLRCFEDNSLIKQQVSTPGGGRILVVDGGASMARALLGDRLAAEAARNGWAGLVIWGAIRDVDDIAALPIGVQALGTVPLKSLKLGIGDLNVELCFGGVTSRPGEWLYADNNSVIVAPQALDV